ncbi:MAG TPA: aldo/keto reductase [Gammaproteobacteria bacterium]|jgi:D-threo-aldose 1-dehydrogenase|nr:aldo/keto reductase [Gammaproteobacteria bacterium]
MSLSTRKLLKSHLSFTELTLGGAQIGNHPVAMNKSDAIALIASAWENGVRVFDTAPLYGYGLSENIFGEVLKKYPREEFILSTKVGRLLVPDANPKGSDDLFPESLPFIDVFDYSYDGIMQSVKESLQRLQMTYLDVVHIHDIDVYTHGDKQPLVMRSFLEKNMAGKSGYDALLELREAKIIRAIGVGSNNWECCLEVIEKTPEGFIDCVQLANRYTLFEQPSLEKLFPACIKRNIKVMIAGPLNSGILSGNSQNRYYNYKLANDEILQKRDRIGAICQKHGITLRDAALKFLLLNPHVVTIVSGMRTPDEVKQNVEALKPAHLPALWKELKELNLMEQEAFTETVMTPKFLSHKAEKKEHDVKEERPLLKSRL